MTRSNAREIAVQMNFALSFGNETAQSLISSHLTQERFRALALEMPLYEQFPNEKQLRYIEELVQGVFLHGPELDSYISRYAVGWAFARIPRMAAAIMRTAMYEVLYITDIPNAAAINEAVEIAKSYEPQEIVAFVNGILGSFVRAEFEGTPAKPEKAIVVEPEDVEAAEGAEAVVAVETGAQASDHQPQEQPDTTLPAVDASQSITSLETEV